MKKILFAVAAAAALLAGSADAMTVRSSLVGSDLTDPENNGWGDQDINYNALFRSSIEPGFGGRENAFNVFDNRVGSGNDKWCCDPGGWVEADFGARRYHLTSFTAASANDAPQRDSDRWQILGSNDGIHYTPIFTYDKDGVSPWGTRRYQVNHYFADVDYDLPAAYSIFRYQTYSVISGPYHQLGELEFFGVEPVAAAVPEPGSVALLGLGMLAVFAAARRKRA